MPKKYDEEFTARAVRLVTDHAQEYDTRTPCIGAVAKRLGVSAETLRRWVGQTEIDAGQRDGVSSDVARENRELKSKNREPEETIEILKTATSFFARESIRDAADLCVHRRASCSVRGRSDLPHAHRARLCNRPEKLLRLQRQGIEVARCIVHRLMRVNGWRGVTRRKKVCTTIADPAVGRAPDLVDRKFRVDAPNVLLVADFAYVRLAVWPPACSSTPRSRSTPTPGESWAGRARPAKPARSSAARSATPQK